MSTAVGDKAPQFTLKSTTGGEVSLADYKGRRAVVLFFYPKDETPVCTKEACSFRDNYDTFIEAGAEVIGISSDSVDSHARFAGKHSLQMTLLSDPGGAVRKRYGVKPTLGIFDGRVTFVIDKGGIVRHVFRSQLNANKHVSEALDVVKAL